MSRYFYFIFILLLTSCGVKQLPTTNFMPMSDPSELNGRYINFNGVEYLSRKLFKNNSNRATDYNKLVDVVDIYFPSKDSLVISLVDITGYRTFRFKGKMKDNFFEYYIENKRFYDVPIFSAHLIFKRRIGKDKEGKLEIHDNDNYRWAGIPNRFEKYDKNEQINLFSVNINGKWGYKNQDDSVLITPQYDYAQLFEDNIAKILLDGKWGYIDTLNREVIPISYDVIMPSENGLLRAEKESKWGVIDLENNIIAPFEYDRIDTFGKNMYRDSLFQNLAKVYKNDKVGFINSKGEEVIPAIYDEIERKNNQHYYWTRLGDKYGYITGDGVFCEPIFDKVETFRSNYNFDNNEDITNELGEYAEVIYQGKSYILGENGMIYPYKGNETPFLSVLKNPFIIVDFESGIKVAK